MIRVVLPYHLRVLANVSGAFNAVLVNGEPEGRRGRTLSGGDVVAVIRPRGDQPMRLVRLDRDFTIAGEFEARRRTQQVDWTWSMVRDAVLDRVLTHPAVKRMRAEVERQVREGELTPALAAQQLLDAAEQRS